jgi:uncharacterized membrane-anchored protein
VIKNGKGLKLRILLLICLTILGNSSVAQTDEDALAFFNLNWKHGPATVEFFDTAKLSYDKNIVSLGSDQANKALELIGNLPSTEKRYIFGRDDFQWFAVINFTKSGYIKDDEEIDASALLKQLKDGNSLANEERRRLGLQTMELVGWSVPPHYNSSTKRLEWGTKLINEREGDITVNYTSRLLGRSGYFSSTLVTNENDLQNHVNEYNKVLTKFEFNPGEKYSEFKPGDKIAEYGLSALVLGGAAAAVVKSKGFWKLVGVGLLAAFAAVIAFLKNFITRKK